MTNEKLELYQDHQSRYCGIELGRIDLRSRNNGKSLRLTLFANNYGTFEASFNLTQNEAEMMCDWLTDFLKEETK